MQIIEDAHSAATTMSVERICACFWAIESKFSLLSWNVNGVYPWPLMRMHLYYRITQQVGLFENPHPAVRSESNAARAALGDSASLNRYWNTLERKHKYRKFYAVGTRLLGFAGLGGRFFGHRGSANPISAAGKPYGLVMATRRVNGTEPYTDALRKELGSNAFLLDRALDGRPIDGAFDLISLQELFRKRYRNPKHKFISKADKYLCNQIREEFSKSLGIDVGDVVKICRVRVTDFISLGQGFEMLFALNPVQTLFLTNAYGGTTSAALNGARLNGAHIVELQHGFISQFHLGYSWPGRPHVPYRPDELWCFGDFWPDSTPLPGQTKTRVIGAPYVHELAGLEDNTRDENLVMFSSQGVIGQRLFAMALETAQRRPDKQVIFRLHPSEALADYEALLRKVSQVPSNFQLSHRTPNIFVMLAKAGFQVGAFSTTLFEGMSLGSRTIVVDLPGLEYMRPVIKRGDVLFVRDVDELVERLDSAPLAADPEYYYAQPARRLIAAES